MSEPLHAEPEHILPLTSGAPVSHTIDEDDAVQTIPVSGARVESAAGSDVSASVVDQLLRVAHQLRGLIASHFAEFDLSDVRYTVLRKVRSTGDSGCSQKQVADELLQSESSISTLIERMRKDGLIYRLTPPRDRRRKALMLSERGRELLGRVDHCHATRMEHLLRGLSETDRQSLQQLLTRMAEHLSQWPPDAAWPTVETRESTAA